MIKAILYQLSVERFVTKLAKLLFCQDFKSLLTAPAYCCSVLHFQNGETKEFLLENLPILVKLENEDGELLNVFEIRPTTDPNSDQHDYKEIDIISS